MAFPHPFPQEEIDYMDSITQELLEEYEKTTGKPFQQNLYLTPALVPGPELDLIRRINLAMAYSRQMDILYAMRRDAIRPGVVLNHPLHPEFEECRRQIDIWQKH